RHRHDISLSLLDIAQPHRAEAGDLLLQQLAAALRHVLEEEVAHRLGRAFESDRQLVLLGVAQHSLHSVGVELCQIVESEHQALDALGAVTVALFKRGQNFVSVLRSRLLKISAMSSWAS